MWGTADMMMGENQGGFLDNTAVDSDQSRSNPKKGNNLMPVMIGQLASDSEELTFWDIPIRLVTVVGVVRNIDKQSTKISFDIEDETGTIVAMKWLEANKETTDFNVSINTYVKVHGVLKEKNGEIGIMILKIDPLESLDELVNHLLEVSFAMLKCEEMQKGTGIQEPVTNVEINQPVGISDENSFGMTKEQVAIYRIIKAQNDTECGIERSEIIRQAPKQCHADINKILEFLTSEGHIYTTSTDDHFKTT